MKIILIFAGREWIFELNEDENLNRLINSVVKKNPIRFIKFNQGLLTYFDHNDRGQLTYNVYEIEVTFDDEYKCVLSLQKPENPDEYFNKLLQDIRNSKGFIEAITFTDNT